MTHDELWAEYHRARAFILEEGNRHKQQLSAVQKELQEAERNKKGFYDIVAACVEELDSIESVPEHTNPLEGIKLLRSQLQAAKEECEELRRLHEADSGLADIIVREGEKLQAATKRAVTDHFQPEITLEAANEKLRAIRRFVFPRVAACSLVPIRRILGLPDEPNMSTETRIELIKDSSTF